MIKAITITNHLDESIRLVLADPESSGFAIKKIDGLGPVKADINFTELATSDGAIDNSARLETRNIVISLIFMPHPTIEDTRLLSYKYFPIKRNIKFLIETDNRICQTVGRVESNEPDIFSQQEGCQISIMCPDPHFYSIASNTESFFRIRPAFKFPFKNNLKVRSESIIDSLGEEIQDSNGEVITSMNIFQNKELKMGDILKTKIGNLYYEGDDDIGVTLEIHAIGKVTGLVIYKIESREAIRINDQKLETILGSGIEFGDTITITTSKGNKTATMLRDGIKTNILNALDRPLNWFQLRKGDNQFYYTAEFGAENVFLTISNDILYTGV